MTKSRGILKVKRRHFAEWEIAKLRVDYPHRPTVEIAAELGRTVLSIYQRSLKMGLRKSAAYMATDTSGRIQRGRTDPRMIATQFPKGHVPANKGLRRPGYARGRMRETQFKKGRRAQEAHNYVPIGTLKVCKDGYLQRKVTNNPKIFPARRWEPVHRIVWRRHRGRIPAGFVVCFRPGRKTAELKKITIGRLELVSRQEMARRNRMWTVYPREVARVIHMLGQVKRRIRQRERDAQESR